MEVLLARDIDPLGRIGDVVDVRPGYARNYLIPRGLARPVTKENLLAIEREKKRFAEEEARRVGSLKDLAAKIQATNVTIEAKTSAEGHLYGSVTAVMIAAELEKLGLPVPAAAVRLEHPLKEIGIFTVPIHLHKDIQTEARVFVVQAKE